MKRPNYVFDDELYHHGIPGQRWYHRRFQNEDGSWTAAGRERYSEGDGQPKESKPKLSSRAKVKMSYEDKKYKMYMKSKEQKLKDKIAAKEERNRVREQAKTAKLARKEQAKIDKKEATRLGTGIGNTKKMSDDDLQTAINRLKMEAEYNKSYAIASKPNGMLARADRFFEGATGKVVRDIAVATIPNVVNTAVSKTLESKLKYANELDRQKMEADIDKVKSETENTRAKADQSKAIAESTRSKMANDKAESENKIMLDRKAHQLEVAKAYNESRRADEKQNADIAREDRKQENDYRLSSSKQDSEQHRLNEKQAQEILDKELDRDIKTAINFGKNKSLTDKYGKEDWNGLVNNTLRENNAKTNAQVEKYNALGRDYQSGNDYETLKKWQDLDQEKRDKEVGRAIAIANYNDISMLSTQGKTEEAKALTSLTSNININNNWQLSHKVKVGYESAATKEVTSKPLSSALSAKDFSKEEFLSNSERSAIKNATGSAEEIAKRFGISLSEVYKIRNS